MCSDQQNIQFPPSNMLQVRKLSATILYLLSFLFIYVKSASVPVTWVSSSYFVTGTFSYSPSITTGFVDDLVTITYAAPLSGPPTRMAILGIANYNFQFTYQQYFFYMVVQSIGQTSFIAQIATHLGSDIVTLRVCYLTVDPSFTSSFSISYFTTAPQVIAPFQIAYYINFTQSTGVILDQTHDNGMLAFLHIINVTSTTLCYNIDVVFQIFNSSYYQVLISSNCSDMTLFRFGFSRIIFDKTAIQALGYCFFQYGEVTGINGNNSALTFTTTPFFANNFMMGMKSFHVNGLFRFRFATSIGTTTTIGGTDAYIYLKFMYWSFKLRACPVGYPYFDPILLICYDVCQNGFYGDLATAQCLKCLYSCTTCSSYSVCTNCNPVTNRYLNGSSCLPNPGYFDNQTANAVLCTVVLSQCLQCINNTTCTKCSNGYYVDPITNNCLLCTIPSCQSCANASSCAICTTGLFFSSVANSCLPCSSVISNCLSCIAGSTTTCGTCSPSYVTNFDSTQCVFNPCTDANCVQCFALPSVCQACITGYIVQNDACAEVCGNNVTTVSEQCDDGNNVDGDGCNADCTTGNNNGCPASTPYISPVTGSCVSLCPDRYFENQTDFACPACYYTCLTCSNSSDCESCSSSNNRYLNGTACLPIPNYFENSTADALPCMSPCLNCTTLTICTSCVGGYYLSGSTCLRCNSSITFCTNCTADGSSCTACQLGYVVNATTGLCDIVPCTDVSCVSCPNSNSVCQACAPGYLLSNNACTEVCGNNVTTVSEQCDDGNNVDGDGCNADCTTGNNNGCPASTPYISPVTGSCVSLCPDRYFENQTDFACPACYYTCLTCSNSSDCESCSSSNNRYLNGTACLPIPNYFENSTADALPCMSPCLNCTTLTICTSCVGGSYLSGSTCLACDTVVAFCANCSIDGTSCSFCQIGYILNLTTGLCDQVPCTDINCLSCPISDSTCQVCIQGYNSIQGLCLQICGDFIKTNNQECDDGNYQDKDGCSTSCVVQPDFSCEIDSNNTLGSICFFIGPIYIDVLYIEKVDGKNQIKIQLDLSPNDLAFWDSVNILDIIKMESPVPVQNINVVRNPDGTVQITFKYSADIQGVPVNITIDPANSGLRQLQRANATINQVIINPDDNQGAYFHQQSTYKMSEIVSSLSTAISGVSSAFLFIGLISGKMIGVQMMAVVQISFFSLMTLTEMNPCFAALSSLRLVNGYNSLSNNNPLNDTFTPTQPKGIYLFSRFTQNFNITAIAVFIPLLVALITFILSKTACKENATVRKVFQRSLGEYTFMMLLFSGYMIAFSSGLQFMYGMKNSSDFIGKISMAECAILLAMMIGYFAFLLIKPQYFGEFTQSFKADKLSQKYYNLMVVERLIVGAPVVFMLEIAFVGAIPIVVFSLILVLILVKKPYKKNLNNYRSMSNMFISAAVQIIYLVFRISTPAVKNSSFFLFLPLVICILLILCVLYNSAAIVYYLYEFVKNYKKTDQNDKQQLQQLNKLRNQSTFLNNNGSPTSVRGPNQVNQSYKKGIDPESIRKKLDQDSLVKIRDIKKQIGRLNFTDSANCPIRPKDSPINNSFLNQYDGI